MIVELTADGQVRITGSSEELGLLAETIDYAAEDGEASTLLLSEDGARPLIVTRTGART
jgi:hypothetical protein